MFIVKGSGVFLILNSSELALISEVRKATYVEMRCNIRFSKGLLLKNALAYYEML